jgi:hypothetical protein
VDKQIKRKSSSGHSSPEGGVSDRHEVVARALEAARIEVVDRLTQLNFPLSLQAQQMLIFPAGDDGSGWNSE